MKKSTAAGHKPKRDNHIFSGRRPKAAEYRQKTRQRRRNPASKA